MICTKCNTNMLFCYGLGFDYDRWICGDRLCTHEVELETSTIPDDTKD